MSANECYENFPLWFVIINNLVSLSIYIIGVYILAGLGILFSALYLLYCLFLEIRLLKEGCVNCYYYGKLCGFGKGKISASLFKKGNPNKFNEREISWINILPDFMVSVFPIVGGVILLFGDFSWIIVVLIIIIIILSTGGTAFIRGSLACRYCKQREIGCPAERLFGEKTS